MSLLCLILQLRQTMPSASHFTWQAEQQENEAVLRCTAVSDGTEPQSHRHSIPEQLYQTGLRTPEEQVVQHFCRKYHAVLLTSQTDTQAQCTLRFPRTGTSGICPWKAAAGRSTTASFRCIRSSFPTFRTTGFIKQHIATHSVKPFRSCRLCGNS